MANNAPPDVEWYPPEIERGRQPDKARVIISGRTQPGSGVSIEGESVSNIRPSKSSPSEVIDSKRQLRIQCNAYQKPDMKSKSWGSLKKGALLQTLNTTGSWFKIKLPDGRIGFVSQPCFLPSESRAENFRPATSTSKMKIENRETYANADGFFELPMDLPQGLIQMPVMVVTPAKIEKTFLLSVEVNLVQDEIQMPNTKISTSKPPAASKKFRFWAGTGFTYQTYSQTSSGAKDLNFSTLQAPGIVARGGYWGDQWGVDFYFRNAPGKIEAAAPLTVQTNSYQWQTMEAKFLYQFERGSKSRLFGLPSQWQLRFGLQRHQIPFLNITNNVVAVEDLNLTMGTLGVGLLLAQESDWSYEFALGYQNPVAVQGPKDSFGVSSPFGYELQLGAAYKFAPGWRLGLFSYTQSVNYQYTLQNAAGAAGSGKQSLFYTTADLRLGYEF